MEITGPPAPGIFHRQEARLQYQVMYGMKKTAVKMRDIIKEMGNHMPEGFPGHYVLLAAIMAIMALYNCPAVKAILFFTLRYMRQCNFFLKISTKKYKKPFFFVTVQLR